MSQNHPTEIHSIIRHRRSPRTFQNRPIPEEKLMALVEAARWSASAFNEQPWRFVIGRQGDEKYKKILSSLVEWNQKWAGKAPVLILNLAKQNFSHNRQPNGTANYDLGQAVATMSLEAVHQGLVAHQMSGFDAKAAASALKIDDEYLPVSVTAIGFEGSVEDLPEDLAALETKTRERKTIDEILF